MSVVRLLFSLSLMLLCLPVARGAEELRIETDVYAGDSVVPLSHTVTLFDSGTAYDFAEKKQEIAVFRLPTSARPGQFVLLDLKLKRRTEVTTDKIEALMDKLTKWALDQDDELLKFSAKPVFEEEFEAGTGQLTLESPEWTYAVATVPAENTKTLTHYRQFADWYTRLNVMMHGAPPPGPRLALNAALEKHGVVPVEIRRTVEKEAQTLRATHMFSWRLSREDRARVDQVNAYLANFEKVENDIYLTRRPNEDVVRGQSK